ncbi:hypothetical protein M3J09_000003 [Ascochyta lentis]
MLRNYAVTWNSCFGFELSLPRSLDLILVFIILDVCSMLSLLPVQRQRHCTRCDLHRSLPVCELGRSVQRSSCGRSPIISTDQMLDSICLLERHITIRLCEAFGD